MNPLQEFIASLEPAEPLPALPAAAQQEEAPREAAVGSAAAAAGGEGEGEAPRQQQGEVEMERVAAAGNGQRG